MNYSIKEMIDEKLVKFLNLIFYIRICVNVKNRNGKKSFLVLIDSNSQIYIQVKGE